MPYNETASLRCHPQLVGVSAGLEAHERLCLETAVFPAAMTNNMIDTKALPFDPSRPVSDLSMVEIAEQLDQVTVWLETERRREQDAREAYEDTAREVETRVRTIRGYAEKLVDQQRRKMSAFDGLLSRQPSAARPPLGRTATFTKPVSNKEPKNLGEAIVSIWALDRYAEPLTTEEIAEALADVGYESDAAATSLRSSINQALAKLCKVGRIVKFRADGSQISPKDNTSRARKYLAAIRLPEPV